MSYRGEARLVCAPSRQTGHIVAMRQSRKLAAILVADVVGFSRLTAADEEDALKRPTTLAGNRLLPSFAAALSSGPATERSSSFAARSTRHAAPSLFRTAQPCATPICRLNGALCFGWPCTSAMSSKSRTAIG